MATQVQQSKGSKWSLKAAESAAQQHRYIKIGPKTGFLALSGAETRWGKPEHAGYVYVRSLRVAGDLGFVRQYFLSQGNSPSDVEQHLATAYTAQNYKVSPFKEAFNAEIEAYKAYKSVKDAQKRDAVSLDKLQYFIDNLPAAAGSTRAASPKAAGSPRTGRVTALADRLKKVGDKVLDVSKMLPNGTGIRLIARPKGPNAKKIGVPGLAIVSSKPELYAAAVRQLGPGYEQYIQAYNNLVAQGGMLGAAPVAAVSPLHGAVRIPSAGNLGTLPLASTMQFVNSPIGSPSRF